MVENWVVVNHAGTVLLPEDLKLNKNKDNRRRLRNSINYLGETITLGEFCNEHGLEYPADTRKYVPRPASAREAGLYYSMPKEKDELLGVIGHMRLDFGSNGDRFWHTWWPRGPEELIRRSSRRILTPW